MKRILLGGLLGGIAMFLWEGLAHEVLPLGMAGIQGLSMDAPVSAAIKQSLKEPGFYIFPWVEQTPAMSGAQKKEAVQKTMEQAKTSPSGLMVVHPEGRVYSFGKLLGTQAVFDVLTMLLAAFLVTWRGALKSYGARVLFVAALGLLPALTVHLPQWNWYDFPAAYTMAQIVVNVVGFLLGALIVAAMVKPARYV
jgi:uncharacterized membrane protein YkgB